MIEIRLLEHAIALAEQGSFAVASQTLGLSQPALSRSIQSLETQLEVQLFDRGHRRVEPTDAGQIFLVHARDIVARNASLLQEMGLAQQNQSTSFTLVVGAYPAETIAGTVLAKMLCLHPDTQLRLRVETWVEAVKLVRAREAELCVAEISQLGDDPELHVEPLAPLQGYFVARAGHPLLTSAPLLPEQILAYPLVSTTRLPPRVLSPLQQHRADATAGKSAAFPALVCEQISIMRQIVAESNALGMFVLPQIEAELRSGTLVPLACELPWLSTQFGIVRLRNRPLCGVGESFVKCIHEAASAIVVSNASLRQQYANWSGTHGDSSG